MDTTPKIATLTRQLNSAIAIMEELENRMKSQKLFLRSIKAEVQNLVTAYRNQNMTLRRIREAESEDTLTAVAEAPLNLGNKQVNKTLPDYNKKYPKLKLDL